MNTYIVTYAGSYITQADDEAEARDIVQDLIYENPTELDLVIDEVRKA